MIKIKVNQALFIRFLLTK